MIGLVLDVALERVIADRELHVFGDVDDDRPGPPVRGDVESLVQDAREILDAAHEIIVLGAASRDAGRVAFLESVGADEMGRHLTGDADERDRIHQRVGEAGDRVGRAGPRGHQQHADLAGRTGIALGGMGRALLVAHENVANLLLVEDRVVDRQDRAAGIAEENSTPWSFSASTTISAPDMCLAIVTILPGFSFVGPAVSGGIAGISGNKKGPQGASDMRQRPDAGSKPVRPPAPNLR